MSRKARVTRADRYERALLRLIAMLEHKSAAGNPLAQSWLPELRRRLDAFRADPVGELVSEIVNPVVPSGPREGPMRQRHSLRSVVIQMLLTGVFLAVAGSNALTYGQQCTISKNIADQSSPGTLRVQAVTNQMYCSGVTGHVTARIADVSFGCSGAQEGGVCYGQATGHSATATAWASGFLACSMAEAYGTHWTNLGLVGLGTGNTTINLFVPGDCGGEEPPCQQTDGGECNSPIVIATGKNAKYDMTSAEDGVWFDIDGDGAPERIAWTAQGSEVAFLAIDLNGDGQINNGKELFGNYTRPDASNGFSALIKMALEENNTTRASLSNDDPLFARLLLWTDSNHNGASDFGEIRLASEVLSDIGLAAQLSIRVDGHGNEFRYRGWVRVRTAPGRNKAANAKEEHERRRMIYDVFFVTAR